MSWSMSTKIGTPEKVRAAVITELDKSAAYYAGKTEEQDVLQAKARIVAWLDEQPTDCSGVQVDACGSRGAGWLSIKVECKQVPLLT